jgi:hypothetical protein
MSLFYNKNSLVAGHRPDWNQLIFCIQPQFVANLNFYRAPSLEESIVHSRPLIRSGAVETPEATHHSTLTQLPQQCYGLLRLRLLSPRITSRTLSSVVSYSSKPNANLIYRFCAVLFHFLEACRELVGMGRRAQIPPDSVNCPRVRHMTGDCNFHVIVH